MLVLPVVAATSLLMYWGTLVNGRRRRGEPPLVRGALPFLGMALPFGRDATGLLHECRVRHGEVFTFFVGGQRMTFVVDPLSHVAVLKAKQLSFRPIADAVTKAAFQIPDLRGRIDLETVEHLGKTELKGEGLVAMTASMAGRLRAVFDALPDAGLSAPVPLFRLVSDTMFEAGTDVVRARVRCASHA